MIIEYVYSSLDLKKKCYGCKWLKCMMTLMENVFVNIIMPKLEIEV